MIQLKNTALTVTIAEQGAELQSIKSNKTGREYLWQADPKFWGKHSPVLFPVVGALTGNRYEFEGRDYHLNRHGFARDTRFDVLQQDPAKAVFSVKATDDTLKVYPFLFRFTLVYELQGSGLTVSYHVQNEGTGPLYFCVGGHPAFKVPFLPDTVFEDYCLIFEQPEQAGIYPLNDRGQIMKAPVPFFHDNRTVPLQKRLFYKDALIFKELKSTWIKIAAAGEEAAIRVHFGAFPYLGIWSAKDAGFVCIEPWQGHADAEDSNGKLTDKEGIVKLLPNEKWQQSWSVAIEEK